MAPSTYVKEKTLNLKSKYHFLTTHIKSSYNTIQGKVVSKFHIENNELDYIRQSLNRLIEKSAAPYLTKSLQESNSSSFSIACNNLDHSYKERIDWTRGRFSGELIKIIIQNGEIVEKVFLTPQRNIIHVKRSELGIMTLISLRIGKLLKAYF